MHAKDKYKCQNFLGQLKNDPDITPFLSNLENNRDYFSDFDLAIYHKNISIQSIDKNLKNNKYRSTKDFYRELRGHFQNFQIYCLEGDEVHVAAKKFIRQVDEQDRVHIEYEQQVQQTPPPPKRQPKDVKEPKQPPVQKQPREPKVDPENSKRATLCQKLEMVYTIRNLEDNFQEIRDIGDYYKIGRETAEEYIIRLEGISWLEMLRK